MKIFQSPKFYENFSKCKLLRKYFKVQTHMKIFLSQKARIFYKYKSVKDTLRPATPDQVWYKSYYFV